MGTGRSSAKGPRGPKAERRDGGDTRGEGLGPHGEALPEGIRWGDAWGPAPGGRAEGVRGRQGAARREALGGPRRGGRIVGACGGGAAEAGSLGGEARAKWPR